jgi:hypothetical protein
MVIKLMVKIICLVSLNVFLITNTFYGYALDSPIINTLRTVSTRNATGRSDLVQALQYSPAEQAVQERDRMHQDFIELMRVEIESKIAPYKDALVILSREYHQALASKDAQAMEAVSDKINAIVDKINLIPRQASDLEPLDNILTVDAFKKTTDYAEYRQQAIELLLEGKLPPQLIFAGAATRMGAGPMYTLDLWELISDQHMDIVEHAYPGSTTSPDNINITMAQRQLLMYVLQLIDIARSQGKTDDEIRAILSEHAIILQVSEDTEVFAIQDLLDNNFYGLNPDNVHIITVDMYNGLRLNSDGTLEYDQVSDRLPPGHGYASMQLAWGYQSFTVSRDGIKQYSQEDVLAKTGAEYFINHRINDLTKFTDQVIDIDRLAYSLYLMRTQGYNIVIDLVGNPANQKGGQAQREISTGSQFLMETSNYKGSDILRQRIESLERMPYNAFRNTYEADSARALLKEGIPYNLRFKTGFFYLEAVTGDITQMAGARTEFITMAEDTEVKESVLRKDLIHDAKAPVNLAEAARFMQIGDELMRDRVSDIEVFIGGDTMVARAVMKSSSAGTTIDGLSDYEAETLLANTLLDYAYTGTPAGITEINKESQAIIVYSDSLEQSPALQAIIRQSAGDSRKFYLVNKDEGISADALLQSLNIDRAVFDRHVFNQNSLSADQLALSIAGFLQTNNIRQGRVFASTEEDLSAWSKQDLIEALVMLLKDKRFEIISNYTEQHMEHIRSYEQVLIAA